MAEELYFPSVDGLENGTEYTADNNVTYTWNTGYSSWMIGSSQQVNKDYVDSRDQLRLRLDGNNHMYGDLIIKQNADAGSEIRASLTQSGQLTLGGARNINFTGDGTSNSSISVGGNDFLLFKNGYVNVEKTINFNRSLSMFGRYTGSKDKVTIVDFNTQSNISASIALAKGPNSYFVIRKSGFQRALFRVRADGGVQCRGIDASRPFSVLPGDKDKGTDDAFWVRQDGGVRISKELNKKLIDSDKAQTPEHPTTVASKGYVDSKSARPGFGIVATKEKDADINGFWRNGNNLYIRIS